ncbi:TM2 domain-containing membrane protein YozV [Agromyces hippuratus]|uniref:TM2 domain-containing membrane protein YozV n=1 Tax=Agromyces hippuratus TaxID=286438 RepID=A0A852WQD6_9MICO|nr:hypothetical protein [Agromyces hippuratus]NYG20156.1 TM2 domain-containing membrane protein YozV [Agromyces hippuratus]
MRTRPTRPRAVTAALAAAVWAFFLLPPQQAVWSGVYIPPWLGALDGLPVYDAIRWWLHGAGLHDFYLVFGAAASVSFVLVWLATGPTLAALGWSGRVLGWLVLTGGVITLLSYLNHPADAPLHTIWGGELFVLAAIGVWAVVAAAVAPRGVGIPAWERWLLGATLPILVGATALLTYWPHGSLVGFALEAAVLAAWAPRATAANDPLPRTEGVVAEAGRAHGVTGSDV